MKTKERGVTLLEAILVLAVGMSILIFSIRQYNSFRLDTDLQAVQYNVNELFGALYNYYQANCSSPPLSGSLAGSFAVSVESLVNDGYLAPIKQNPLVKNNNYVVQLNAIQVLPRNVGQEQIGSYTIWQAQVAIEFADADTASAYMNMLNAQCLSHSSTNNNATTVTPCGTASAKDANYVVFERSPSLALSTNESNAWITMPIYKLFNQTYTTYPVLYSIGNNGNLPNGSVQYLFCGS